MLGSLILILGWQQIMLAWRARPQQTKGKFKMIFVSTNRDMIPDYLAELMWNQQFNEHSNFYSWIQVTQLYPELPGKSTTFFKSTHLLICMVDVLADFEDRISLVNKKARFLSCF